MKAKQKVSVGIDGITCVVSGVFVLDEIHYPRESLKPILKITPKNKTTEIGIILPHTIRKDNNIGFRVSDTKMLADVVQAINRGLKSTIHRDWSELYVRSVEVACTVDINCTDKCAVDSAVKFLCRCLLQEDRVNKCFGNMCGIMKQTFEYAVDKEYTDKNPYRVNVSNKKIIPDRKKASREEVYNEEEEKLIREEMERRLANNPSNTAPLAVLLDFELGVRKGELLALKSTDIHDGYIHIGRQVVEKIDVADEHNIKGKGFVAVEYTKTESGIRDIPLTDRAKKIIERVININQKGGEYYQDFLFVRNGYLMSPDAIDAQIKRGCEYIGIQVKTMHKIRKTVASKLIENGVSVSATKDILGHADESTTLRYYIYDTDTQDENNKKVLNALGNGGESTRFNEYDSTNVRQREIKIIPFHKKEKAENPIKYKAFHS